MKAAPTSWSPLRTRGVVALIDDDQGFLLTLAELLASDHYRVQPFSDPAALHAFLGERIRRLTDERAKIGAIWRAQVEPQGTVAVDALRYFASPERFDSPLVLVSDYAMPRETGLSVCSKYGDSGLQRILLTGVADTNIAVSAFNSGYIEQYVQKQGTNFPTSIIDALERQLQISAAQRGGQLAANLRADLITVLANEAASDALQAYLKQLNVCEFMMLGDPQGMLAITRTGTALWIQLETASSLEDLEDILSLAEVSKAAVQRVRQRESLVAVEWMPQLGLPPEEGRATRLCAEPLLLAASFDLQLPADLQPAMPAESL